MLVKLEKSQKRSKRICLVLGPNEGIYFENNSTKTNSSIPSGGWLWGVDGSSVTKSKKHYLENQSRCIEQTNIEQRYLHISATDEEKIEIIKQNPIKFYIGENSYLLQGIDRISYLKNMLEKSIMKEDYEICIKIKTALKKLDEYNKRHPIK
jgi:hypothetical protein